MTIVRALAEDNAVLTDLTIASKAYWDYSKEQIDAWIPDLTITSAYIEEHAVFKLIKEEEVIGYYSYCMQENNQVLLDNMFISPDHIGTGMGGVLMDDLLARTNSEGISAIITYSDPNSEEFYIHFGFEQIGKEPTSIENRFLPILEKLSP
ncbi:MAG: GNAT family N-acetyltransferase [Crocinitomicaceae bacterium]